MQAILIGVFKITIVCRETKKLFHQHQIRTHELNRILKSGRIITLQFFFKQDDRLKKETVLYPLEYCILDTHMLIYGNSYDFMIKKQTIPLPFM